MFIKGKKYFLCGLPYQLSIQEGLLMKEQVIDEMQEEDFNSLSLEIVTYISNDIRKNSVNLITQGCIVDV
jgi:hypothetical protein